MTRPTGVPDSREIHPAALRAIRKRSGISATALAELAGISVGYLRAIEGGRRGAVSVPIQAALARVLRVDVFAITQPANRDDQPA